MAAAGQRRNRSRRTLSNHRLRWLDPQRLHQSDGFDPLALRLVCGPFVAWPRRCPPLIETAKQRAAGAGFDSLYLCTDLSTFMRNLLLNRSEQATILGESLPPSIAVLSPK